MANITIAGDAVVIKSTATLEELALLEKYRPEALELKTLDENNKMVTDFKIGTTTGQGKVSKFGISFGKATHDEEQKAMVTTLLPDGIDEESVMAYVADTYGSAVIKLNAIEDTLALNLQIVKADREAVLDCITMA